MILKIIFKINFLFENPHNRGVCRRSLELEKEWRTFAFRGARGSEQGKGNHRQAVAMMICIPAHRPPLRHPLWERAGMRVLSHSLVLEHYEGVNGLHTTSCREDQQGIDVQFVQTSIKLHGQMGDVDQGLR
jgi:hypothetical protein